MSERGWWIVTIREAFDDEDTMCVVQASSRAEAVRKAKKELREGAGRRIPEDDIYILHVVDCGKSEPVIVQTP